MNKSMSLMKSITDKCLLLRKQYYGEQATVKDYKDSFVINKAIDDFRLLPEKLMSDSITAADQAEPKVSKSVNYRSDCFQKLTALSETLGIPDSEVCRRILYYSLEEHGKGNDDMQITTFNDLKLKAADLKKQMKICMATLNELTLAISLMEGGEINE